MGTAQRGRGAGIAAGAIAWGLLLSAASARQDAQDGPAAPRDHALLVGCTDYPKRPARTALKGCANDVELMRERFVSVLGLVPERIQVLSGWPDDAAQRPTRDNILGALRGFATGAAKGDRVLVFLAGHGSQQPDGRDGDEEDGYDEIFLPSDVGRTVRRAGRKVVDKAITDDELYGIISDLLGRGIRVCLFSDSCHSATLARGADRRSRGIEPEEFDFDPVPGATRGGRAARRPGDVVPGAGFVGLYAVQADEQAMEDRIAEAGEAGDGGRIHGIFTWSLARALSRTGGDATFDDLFRLVIAGYRELGYHDLTPFLQGERGAPVRGDAEAAGSSLFARRAGELVEVDGGSLHGLLPGSRLAVQSADGSETLAEVRIVAATSLRSRCAPVAGASLDALPEGEPLPVKVLETPAGGRALTAHVVSGAEPPWVAELRKLDPGGSRVRLVDAPEGADWTLEEDRGSWRLFPGDDSSARRYRVPGASVPATLLGLHRAATLLRLPARAGNSALPEGLQVEVRRGGVPLADGDAVRPGTELVLHAFNGTATPYDLWVFWIDADYGVSRVFPEPGVSDASAFLVPARKARQTTFEVEAREVALFVTDLTQGPEQFLFLAVPPTTSDLSFLESARLTPDTRGNVEGEAAELFSELAFGPGEGEAYTRGLGAGTHVAMLSLEMSWEPVRTPAVLEGRAVDLPAAASPASDPKVPDPWPTGERVHVHEQGSARVVADRAEAPRVLLFDLDAPALLPDAELGDQLQKRTWEAELALVFDPRTGRRCAFYDTDLAGGPGQGSPRFDLIRIDEDGDGRADREHRFADGAWIERDEPAAPWLRLAELDFVLLAPQTPIEAEDAALALLRQLCCPTEADG